MSDVDLSLEGMHCDGCVRRVSALLRRVPGVRGAKVEVGRVQCIADTEATVATLITALGDAGFPARPRSP